MTARVMMGILLLHVATTFGAVAASAQPPACEESRDFLCGTPLEGLFGRADEVSVSANPFRFAGSVLTLIGIMEGLTWYDYEILNVSENVLVSAVGLPDQGVLPVPPAVPPLAGPGDHLPRRWAGSSGGRRTGGTSVRNHRTDRVAGRGPRKEGE